MHMGFILDLRRLKEWALGSEGINKHNGDELLENRIVNFSLQEQDCKKIVFGVSIHSVYEAIEAEKLGADYLIAGHVFETDCKSGLKGRGIEFIQNVCESVSIPVIAIGGISESNINMLVDTKVFGVAVMSYGMRV